MRLTMKAIIRWEQLNQKPFAQISYTSEDEVVSLFYVCEHSDDLQTSLEEFRKNLTEESVKEMMAAFERRISLMAQFQSKAKGKEAEEDAGEAVYIKDIVSMLVMNGLDVFYALNDMELCDLPIFLKAYDAKAKERLTAQRLWTFIQVSPHLSKKTKTPKDLYPFAWEMHQNSLSEEELEKAQNEFKLFRQSGLTT